MERVGKIVAWTGAAFFVGTYLVLLILQFSHLGTPDSEWLRRLELLNPLQSLAFAGAGVLLGTAVQQQATRKAEEVAAQNQEDANVGRAMKAAVAGKMAAPGNTPQVIEELAAVAEKAQD